MNDVLYYVVSFVLNLASFLFIARFLLQATRADFYNPISQGIISITDPVLKPLRSVIPGIKNFDVAAFLMAIATEMVLRYAVAAIGGHVTPNVLQIFGVGVLQTLLLCIQVFWWSILIVIIASFVAPGTYHPALALLSQITEPLLAPARRLIPPMGGLDFSPIVVFLILGVIERILPQVFQSVLF